MNDYFGVSRRTCPYCGQPHSGRWLDQGEGDYFVWHVCEGGDRA